MAYDGLLSVESLKLVLFSIILYFIYVYLLKPALHFVHMVIHYHGFPCYPKHFLLGNLKQFWTNFPYPFKLESIQKTTLEMINKIAAHSDQPISVLWASIYPIIIAVNYEAIEPILNKNNLKKTYQYKFMGLGNGLVTSEPALWKVRRKLIEPFFSTKKIKVYAKYMNEEVKSFAEQLDGEVGKPVDLESQIHRSTLNIILKAATSIPLNDSIEAKKSITKLVSQIEPNTVKRGIIPIFYYDWVFKFFEFGQFYFKTLDMLSKSVTNMLNRRKQLLHSSSSESENSEDFVHLLEGKVDEQGLYDELITMIGAGHETTAMALRWLLFNLGNHLDVQERLFQEIVQFFPNDTPVYDMEKINQCVYLDQCIKESLRVNPPLHGFIRSLEEDTMVKDKRLLRGSIVAFTVPPIHLDPNVYPNPEKYDPERWSPENASKIPKTAFIPFGYGPRICIGYRYAMAELKIYTIQIVRKFSIRSTRKYGSIPCKTEIILKPLLPLEIIITPRNNN